VARPRRSGGTAPVAQAPSATRLAVVAAVLALAVFSPLRRAEYVQDDHLAVEQNAIVERGDLGEIFSTSYWAGAQGEDHSLYRPLAILSYALERRFVGHPSPLLSHAVNVLLHIATSILLVVLALRLGAGAFAAGAAGLLFAVHPVHVEAVANVVGRAEILACLFTLLALWLQSHAGPWPDAGGRLAPPSAPRVRLAAWSAGLAVFCALAAKEVALALPALMLALEWLFRPRRGVGAAPRPWPARVGPLVPAAVAALVWLALRVRALEALVVVQAPHPADNPLITVGGGERWATAVGLLARYARLLCFPQSLSADYSGPVIAIEPGPLRALPLIGLALLVLLGVLSAAALLRPGGERSRVGFAALLFLLPYLIVGNLLVPIGTIFAERLLYLPSAGFCLLFGLALAALARGVRGLDVWSGRTREVLVALILATLVMGYATRSWARALDWTSDQTVFASAARVTPQSPRALFILGKLHVARGETAQALEAWQRTIERYPAYVAAWFERGVAYGQAGRFDEAERMFRETVRLSPNYGAALLNHGIALRRLGRLDEAERQLRKAVLCDPTSARGFAELGNLQLERGAADAAARSYRRAIALGRDDLRDRLRVAESVARHAEVQSAPSP